MLCLPFIFLNLSRAKQLSLHLTDQRTNVTFAVIDAIQTEAISLNNYSLGSQYIRQWFHFRVLLELKAGCHFCLMSCLVLAEFSTSLRKNFCGALVRQPIGLYRSAFLRLFMIHTISVLYTFNRSRSFVTR